MTQADLEAIESSWCQFFEGIPPSTRQAVRGLIERDKEALADLFYERMLQDAQASQFLTHQAVGDRLHASMQRWLLSLFSPRTKADISALVREQTQIGEVHGKIGISISLMYRGARVLRGRITNRLCDGDIGHREGLYEAIVYVSESFDYALEVMNSAYSQSRETGARVEESFRLFSVSQDLLVEKERQRAALLDWENQLVYFLASGASFDLLPKISNSDFGLWFLHKGDAIFGDAPELPTFYEIIDRIDGMLAPDGADLCAVRNSQDGLLAMMRRIQEQTAHLKYLLNAIFDRMFEMESGRDSLTHLLNRRFLPVVLRKEIAIARRSGKPFSILLADVDSFKRINDTYGHAAGDAVLQQVAAIVLKSIRVSDHAFRYGGEEFLLLLAGVEEAGALVVAEKIRRRIAGENFVLPGDRRIEATISIGIAVYDGHPDYERVVKDADAALYLAKAGGRNRSVCSGRGERRHAEGSDDRQAQ